MLYLNCYSIWPSKYVWTYLTLTSVVFEWSKKEISRLIFPFNFNKCCIWILKIIYFIGYWFLFNFNKCCIWINEELHYLSPFLWFNFNKCCIWMQFQYHLHLVHVNLTLTSVVFEYCNWKGYFLFPLYLTLTSVVFEFRSFLWHTR